MLASRLLPCRENMTKMMAIKCNQTCSSTIGGDEYFRPRQAELQACHTSFASQRRLARPRKEVILAGDEHAKRGADGRLSMRGHLSPRRYVDKVIAPRSHGEIHAASPSHSFRMLVAARCADIDAGGEAATIRAGFQHSRRCIACAALFRPTEP